MGIDVHDVGDYKIANHSRLLERGMVMTIEPGIYISPDMKGVSKSWKGIGIRLEDDVGQRFCLIVCLLVPKKLRHL